MTSTQELIKRIKQQQRVMTHWEGCEEEHLLCACIKQMELLEKQLFLLAKKDQQDQPKAMD